MIRLFLAAALISFSMASFCIDVDLRPKVILDKKSYTLSDIASVSGQSAKQLSSIVIGTSPRPGTKLYLGVDQIKSRLYRVRPDIVDSIQWRGANAISIVAQGRKMPVDRVVVEADKALAQWSEQQDFFDYHYSSVQVPNEILLPQSGELSLAAKVAHNTGKTYKRMSVWVDVLVDGKSYHSYQLWYRFRATKMAYIASKPLSKATRLDKTMFERAVIDATQVSGLPVSQLASIENKRLSSNLLSGEALTFEVIETVPLVTKGETVDVDVYVAGVGIQTKAIALKNGRLQETISVLNPLTKDSYLATVIDRNKVRVE